MGTLSPGAHLLDVATLQAPVGFMEGRRRPLRPGHVLVTIEDLLIVTWEVPEAKLRKRLPCGLVPWSRDGSARMSALLFRNRALRPARLGFPRFSCTQMNLRSYILDPRTGEAGSVFFHGLFLGAAWLTHASSLLFRVPFRALPFSLQVERDGNRIRLWEAASADGTLRVAAREMDKANSLDAGTLDLLTNPHTGFFERSGRQDLRAWSIWHRSQTLHTMTIEEAKIHPLDEIGIAGGRAPACGLYVPSIDYEVYLPARKVSVG